VTDPCKDDRLSPHKELSLTAGLAKLHWVVEDNWSRLQIPRASGISRVVQKEISRIKAHIFVGYTSTSASFFSYHPGK